MASPSGATGPSGLHFPHYDPAPPRQAITASARFPSRIPGKCERSARSKSDLHHQVFTIGPVGWARVAPQEVRVYMQLGDILVGRGLLNAADIEAALARQLLSILLTSIRDPGPAADNVCRPAT